MSKSGGPISRWFKVPVDAYEPLPDAGFFGPDSVCWKVWSYPSSLIVGFTRAVTIEQLDPNLNAAVEGTGGVRYRPRTRYERTMRYFAMALFGDTASAAKAADVLVKVHSKAVGTNPVTGQRYDANDPASQLWILITAWHSILYSYEKLGGEKLTDEEDRQYWEECARAAQLQTIDPADVPRSRQEVRQYFEEWRPKLAASELAQSMTEFILRTEVAFPDHLPPAAQLVRKPVGRFFAKSVVATYPRYMRKMFGIRQSTLEDRIVLGLLRPMTRFIADHKWLYWKLGEVIVPTTMPIAGPVVFGIPPKSPKTMTPREAQKLYGYGVPSEAHMDFRAVQAERVFGKGEKPSDEGLLESEQFIGPMADAG